MGCSRYSALSLRLIIDDAELSHLRPLTYNTPSSHFIFVLHDTELSHATSGYSSFRPCPHEYPSSRSLSNDCCIIISIFTQIFGTSLLPRCPYSVEPISSSHLQRRSLWFHRLFIIVLIDDSLRGLEAVGIPTNDSSEQGAVDDHHAAMWAKV